VGNWVLHLNIGKLLNANLPNENYSHYSFLHSVQDFSVKVFTGENTDVLAGRWVKVDKRGKVERVEKGEKAEKVEEVEGLAVSMR